jgi:hypothetical protein
MLRILGKILRHALIYFFYVSAWCVNIIEGRSVFFVSYYFVFVRQANKVFWMHFNWSSSTPGVTKFFLRFGVYPTFFSSMFSMMAISCILVFTLS